MPGACMKNIVNCDVTKCFGLFAWQWRPQSSGRLRARRWKAALAAMLAALVASLFASPSFALGGATPEAKISRLYIVAHGATRVLRIELPVTTPSYDGCTMGWPGTTLLIRELDDSKASAQFLSMVQLAYATDATVTFWLGGCTSAAANYWGANWPVPQDIYIRR